MPSRRELWLGCVIFTLLGFAAMIYLNGAGLTSPSRYHSDLTQSPHWVAYHGEAFAEDDLLVEYASHNESPVQNAIYWVGTLLLDIVLLNKIVGVLVFGLTAGLFFGLVASISGTQVGILAASFFMLFPRSEYEIAGGFSKAWAIGFVLLAVYVVETRRWRALVWLLPLGSLTYPVAPVLIGGTVVIGLLLELPRSLRDAMTGAKWLVAGSAVGILPLLYKYLTPHERIGTMISTPAMKGMWQTKHSSSFTIPLWEDVFLYLEKPFFLYGGVVLLMLLGRRGLVWKRSWTALVVASAISYYIADLVVPRLYLPDRYSRFTAAVLLVLWNAHNWSRVLEALRSKRLRVAAGIALIFVTGFLFSNTFKPCDGEQGLGCWEAHDNVVGLSAAVAALPPPVLLAGHPMTSANVMVQAGRPVLVIHRMFHPWYWTYYKEVDTRIQETIRALYAREVATVNDFAQRYGVTHLMVPKTIYSRARRKSGRIYKGRYDQITKFLARDPPSFVLSPPPKEATLFEDQNYWLVSVPLERAGQREPGNEE